MKSILFVLFLALFSGCLSEEQSSLGGNIITNDENEAAQDWAPAWGPETAPLRPGAPMPGCTFNWVFFDNHTAYIGGAAHCTEMNETIDLVGYGPIGTVVYDSDDYGSIVDFSLIEIYPEVIPDTNPKMYGYDGPKGFVTVDDLAVGDIVDLHGYGMVLGENDLTRERQGFLTAWTENEYVVNMPAVYGDSGSALLHDPTGKALGIISRFGFAESPPSTDRGPLMPFIFEETRKAGFDIRLATI